MVSVTKRISTVKQPRGGFIKPTDFVITKLLDIDILNENENIHASLVGLAVDYLTRLLIGEPIEEVFKISLLGASKVNEFELALDLMQKIHGVDENSVVNACKLVGFDVAYRSGVQGYRAVEDINPDEATILNVKIMVNRGLNFITLYGPIVKSGFTFEGGYTSSIKSGDGDFLTANTLWDYKVSKSEPTNKHTLQLLIYYLMGLHSIHSEFQQIKNLGMFNPRLNKVYLLPVSNISNEIINEVNSAVIGY